MTNPLIGIVELGINAAENVAPEEASALLKGLGLSASGLAAAAEEHPEVAVAGVIVGAALVAVAGARNRARHGGDRGDKRQVAQHD